MKIVIDNLEFNYNIGCSILKSKYKNECPFDELDDIWNDIKPITLFEVLKLENVELRRTAMKYLDIDVYIKEKKVQLINKTTLNKKTKWIINEYEIEHEYEDVYELYKIDSKYLNSDKPFNRWSSINNQYFLEFKDTSTERKYHLWVDIVEVFKTNNPNVYHTYDEKDILSNIDAIDCIAWTFQTNVPKENIEKIIRQGDAIMFKTKGKYKPLKILRHLTKKEYIDLLELES